MTKSKNLGVIAVFLVAILSTAVLVCPVMANTAQISGQMTALLSAPTISSVQGSNDVACTPNGVTQYTITVYVNDPSGWAQVHDVTAQAMKGASTMYGTPIVATTSTQIDTNTARFTIQIPFPYYWPTGSDWGIQVTAHDTSAQASNTVEGPSGGLTYDPASALIINTGSTLQFGSLHLNDVSAVQTATMSNAANSIINIRAQATSPWQSSTSGGNIDQSTLTAQGTSPQINLSPTLQTLFSNLPVGGTAPPTPVSSSWQETVPSSVVGGFLGVYSIGITVST